MTTYYVHLNGEINLITEDREKAHNQFKHLKRLDENFKVYLSAKIGGKQK
jgi:hypothetical protein